MNPQKASLFMLQHRGNWLSAERYQTSGFFNKLLVLKLIMTFDFGFLL
jgi:hypothetical protein